MAKLDSTPGPIPQVGGQERNSWIDSVSQLQDRLALCPTDILTRCELAIMLEELAQHEEALFNWKAVLACDPNNLMAREGVARCRKRIGRPLQSMY
ncbi:MAG: hypothetical protein NNA30_11675 [Nitrospira sp.]|jgi:thioredoxin-like negative regulator of GroEL|nr:hypothetical protein [Nitrospira sp.]